MRIAVLSSTPLNPLEGSGTFVGIAGIARGLEAQGHQVEIRPLRRRTRFHTLDRWLYNLGVALSPPRDVDLVMGVDLDGFLWARRRQTPFVASLKGIIADELRNERGWVRMLLAIQARWEGLNARRADLVMVTSQYCADVARREYGVPASRIAIVPEPIDLETWDDHFARAGRRSRSGPVVLSPSRGCIRASGWAISFAPRRCFVAGSPTHAFASSGGGRNGTRRTIAGETGLANEWSC